MRRFMGMVNQYRSQLPNLGAISKVLTDMTKKSHPTTWSAEDVTDEQNSAFNTIKTLMTKAPVLGVPRKDCPYKIRVDASNTGIGATLSQHQDGRWVLIACVSRALNEQEARWTTHEREGLGVIYALEKFKSYVHTHKFVIETDHRNLQWLMRLTADKGKLSRWGTTLSQWSFKLRDGIHEPSALTDLKPRSLVHIPGSQMYDADAISRQYDIKDGGSLPLTIEKEDIALAVLYIDVNAKSSEYIMAGDVHPEDSDDESRPEPVPSVNKSRLPTLQMLVDAQKSDPFCGEVTNTPSLLADPDNMRAPYVRMTLKDDGSIGGPLYVEEGILMRKYASHLCDSKYLIVVPAMYHTRIIEDIHYSSVGGHLGMAKTHAMLLQAGFWFPDMQKKVRVVVGSCRQCQKSKAHRNSKFANRQSHWTHLPSYKWHKISIDFVGPLTPDKDGFTCLLVVMDVFTKYCIVIPTKDMTAETVARALVFDIFIVYGFPQVILSDKAGNFNQSFMAELYRIMQIHKVTTSPYTPQCNGANEVSHKFLFNIIRILCEDARNVKMWVDCAKIACFSWNVSTVEALDNLTPFGAAIWTDC